MCNESPLFVSTSQPCSRYVPCNTIFIRSSKYCIQNKTHNLPLFCLGAPPPDVPSEAGGMRLCARANDARVPSNR